jgi:tryptophan synthase alpha chain
MQKDLADSLPASIARLRSVCALPICVGFGIATPAHARAVGALADGIVVGSAIVQAADRHVDDAVALAGTLRSALDEAG